MRFRTLIAVATSMLTLAATPTPATAAQADSMVITGSATIVPGLSTVPSPQSIQFGGAATVVGTDGILATYFCSFWGTLTVGTVQFSAGEGSGSCGPIFFHPCTVVMVGLQMNIACASAPSLHVGLLTGLLTPNDVNPTTSYVFMLAGGGGTPGLTAVATNPTGTTQN